MAVDADNAVADLPVLKHLLFLYKDFPDSGKSFLIILCVSEYDPVLPMDVIPLYEELFREFDYAVLRIPEAFLFHFLQ